MAEGHVHRGMDCDLPISMYFLTVQGVWLSTLVGQVSDNLRSCTICGEHSGSRMVFSQYLYFSVISHSTTLPRVEAG
jgi:hypothetical protein